VKARFETLSGLLAKTLTPVYWVSGDEPFQLDQACNMIRDAAKAQGYSERQVFHAERGFNWEQLQQSADSLSLFAERKLIEIRMPSGKPGKEGSKMLQAYVTNPSQDTILLLISGKLEPAAQKTKWFKAVEQAGVIVQVWPLDAARLPQWLQQRMKVRDMSATPEALRLLADRIEGNLLAADQEIEKLLLLYGPGHIEAGQVQSAVANSARFDVFTLVDEALSGNAARVCRILQGLRSEGTEPVLLLWALAREIRALLQMRQALANGEAIERVMAAHFVWDKRKPMIRKALQRHAASGLEIMLQQCHKLDRLTKGYRAGEVWDELLELALQMAGKPALAC
jgi:DNA polymerase-3 subunit delta